ncbi:DUF4148 domain-containing protein [Trinickia caryophylli]|uniref:DUF4148 domain-containing protein n=1 Tax=Trinickia caryophylli TaxID=28094 RepID=A0A1X7D1R1_TRICW|nr:DUF4148 domain-containing protein [Trinickia caryophylli]PMS13588.1 DUF4148 domain-containing protein [Trinickia caryophylli]TRX15242.1 DUF4148 domain-containing protein [Trinickia caryophylli]WQE15115.1 DUF4148 domain-containing protein [Trinickia caryophylli]SMF07093.1 protein of unknown function [Trinickia caryophylli]GLU31147.1 hypothetical protein Busp01_09890 [Trinickia caryophylli]
MRQSLFRARSWHAALGTSFIACSALFGAMGAQAQSRDPAARVGEAAAGSPTRAAVKAELAELVAAGYNPRDWYHYPDNLWAAQRIVDQRHAALAQSDGSMNATPAAQPSDSMGGTPEVRSEAGAAMPATMPLKGSRDASCTGGPICSIYFGH